MTFLGFDECSEFFPVVKVFSLWDYIHFDPLVCDSICFHTADRSIWLPLFFINFRDSFRVCSLLICCSGLDSSISGLLIKADTSPGDFAWACKILRIVVTASAILLVATFEITSACSVLSICSATSSPIADLIPAMVLGNLDSPSESSGPPSLTLIPWESFSLASCVSIPTALSVSWSISLS